MPISVQGPDGTLNQFPDGTPDAVIERAMAEHYPPPSAIDRAVASPVGRFVHDVGVRGLEGAAGLLADVPIFAAAKPGVEMLTRATEGAYEGALARNRNTPGYAKARTEADAVQARKGSGFQEQMFAPFLPTMAGVLGLPGGFDAMNANADAQTAAQGAFAGAHPILSVGAGLLGGLASGRPGYPAALPSVPQNISAFAGSPEAAAVEYLQSRFGADPARLRAAQQAAGNKPLTTAEALGTPAEIATGALARREGATAGALGGTLQARNEAMQARILDDYAQASGFDPHAARGDIDAFIEANQKAATPLYEEAYKANTNVASPMLDRILETPAGKKALADARVKMQNDMSLMGTPDAELMEQAREAGQALPSRGAASGMKLRVYDYVKKSLQEQANAAYKAGNNHEAGIINDLAKSLTRELDAADVTAAAGPNSVRPEGGAYARARAKAGEYLSAKKQFEAGQGAILDNNLSARDFAAQYAKLGDADKQAYMGGAANKLFNLQQTGKLKADVFKSPLIRQKLATIMGDAKAASFLRNMETERQMAAFSHAQAPRAGSGTAGWQAAMADQDANAGLAADALQFGESAARRGVLPAITDLAISKARDAAAAYMTRGMSIPVRDAAGRLLVQNPIDTAAYLEGLPQLPPRAAFQRPSLPNLQVYPYPLPLLSLPQVSTQR